MKLPKIFQRLLEREFGLTTHLRIPGTIIAYAVQMLYHFFIILNISNHRPSISSPLTL